MHCFRDSGFRPDAGGQSLELRQGYAAFDITTAVWLFVLVVVLLMH